jgi:mannose-6-phosphate isomerase-like protein (cupin superfamily)
VTDEYLRNVSSGERIAIIATGAATGGRLFSMEYVLAPGGAGVDEHFHPNAEMRIRVLSGTLTCRVGGAIREISPGEVIVLPPGTLHDQRNCGTEEVHAIEEYRPALRFDAFFESLYRLAEAGALNRRLSGLLQTSATMWEFRGETKPGTLPARAIIMLLAPIARLLGYHGRYVAGAA